MVPIVKPSDIPQGVPEALKLSSFFSVCHRLHSRELHLLSVLHQVEFLSAFETQRTDKTKISSLKSEGRGFLQRKTVSLSSPVYGS